MYKYMFLAIISLFSNAFAQQNTPLTTIVYISVNNYETQPNWEFQITPIIQQDLQSFVDQYNMPLQVNRFYNVVVGVDFHSYLFYAMDESYEAFFAVTAINKVNDPNEKPNPKCVFLLSPSLGEGDFHPNVVTNFNGANCSYVMEGELHKISLDIHR